MTKKTKRRYVHIEINRLFNRKIIWLLSLVFSVIGCATLPEANLRTPDNSHIIEDVMCDRRDTDVTGALENLGAIWKAQRSQRATGWEVSVPEGSSRSRYEIYTRYAGLGFVLGISPESMMDKLREAGKVGPKITSGWDWQDYSRMGEAAIIANKPMNEAMEFLKSTWTACKWKGWNYIDLARVASAGVIADSSPERVCDMLNDVYHYSTSGLWSNNSYSRVAEGAIIAGVTVEEAAHMLDEVYRSARRIGTRGWDDDDYARVARTALLAGIEASGATTLLKEIKDSGQSGWNRRDYSRMTAAAIVAGKSSRQVAAALRESWEKRRLSGSGWGYADYATTAAAGLIGPGQEGVPICGAYLKAW